MVWVHAHNESPCNEMADWLAKCGMENMRQMNGWTRSSHIYDAREWVNVSPTAMRREASRMTMSLTYKDWETHKKKKIEIWKEHKEEEEESLSSYLVKWNIRRHWIYKKERRLMSWKDYSMLCSFRIGHVDLNAQKKFGNSSRVCGECDANEEETMEHFLFVCEGHAEPRREWMRKRRRLLTEKEALRWNRLSTEGRLKEVLFPFQERLRRVPENEKQALEEKRMDDSETRAGAV